MKKACYRYAMGNRDENESVLEDLFITWFIKLRMVGINDTSAFIKCYEQGCGIINSRLLEKGLT